MKQVKELLHVRKRFYSFYFLFFFGYGAFYPLLSVYLFVRRTNRPDLVDQPRCHDFHPACLGNHERFNEKAYRAFDDGFTVDGFICLFVLTIQII